MSYCLVLLKSSSWFYFFIFHSISVDRVTIQYRVHCAGQQMMISVTKYLVENTAMCALGHMSLYFDPIEMGRVPKNNRILHINISVIILTYVVGQRIYSISRQTQYLRYYYWLTLCTRFEILYFVLVVFVQRVRMSRGQ